MVRLTGRSSAGAGFAVTVKVASPPSTTASPPAMLISGVAGGVASLMVTCALPASVTVSGEACVPGSECQPFSEIVTVSSPSRRSSGNATSRNLSFRVYRAGSE